jgi:hypothetical protein
MVLHSILTESDIKQGISSIRYFDFIQQFSSHFISGCEQDNTTGWKFRNASLAVLDIMQKSHKTLTRFPKALKLLWVKTIIYHHRPEFRPFVAHCKQWRWVETTAQVPQTFLLQSAQANILLSTAPPMSISTSMLSSALCNGESQSSQRGRCESSC